jgi:tetratricopeptide (TPR) repeat protein
MLSRPRSIALLLIWFTLVIYLPVAWDKFINFDDPSYVVENSHVQSGLTWAGVKWAFTSFSGSNWHPLTWISHMTDCQLFGPNPAWHHFINALLHAINAALVFLFLQRLIKSIWINVFLAALFACHPMHVESVAWVSERKDVLSTLFAVLSLLAYMRYAQEKYRPAYWWALVCFALGLLAKPMVVTIPCLLLLLDWWPLERWQPGRNSVRSAAALVFEKWPFIILTAASCVITYRAQQTGGAINLSHIPPHVRLEEVVIAYGVYLYKIAWPLKLAVFYPLPDHARWVHSAAALYGTLLILISWVAWRARSKAPHLLFGWAWFLVMLAPVAGVVQIGSALVADRYTYLPMLGISIALALACRDLVARHAGWLKPVAMLAVLYLSGCIVLTEFQLRYWQNSATLFAHAAEVSPNRDISEIHYAVALASMGDFTNALTHYRKAATLSPDNPATHGNIGALLLKFGEPEAALPEYQQAARLAPEDTSAHNGVGQSLLALNRLDEALAEFERTATLDPANFWGQYESAEILLQLRRQTEAVDRFRKAVRIDPNNIQLLTRVAQIMATAADPAARDGQSAITLALKADQLAGGTNPNILDVLGMAYAAAGDFGEAEKAAKKALAAAQAAKLRGLDGLEKRLSLYQKHQPWIETFGATNAPSGE